MTRRNERLVSTISVKGFIKSCHGEGFGLPMFEAAYHKVPVLLWAGAVKSTFYMLQKKKKGKKSKKKMSLTLQSNHQMGKVQPQAVWQGVIEEHALWAYPVKSYKTALRDVYENHKV